MALILLPLAVLIRGRRDHRRFLENVRQAWSWRLDDVKWLMLIGPSQALRKIRLPEVGKFNAGQKLNFMVLTATYPLYVLTGVLIWVTDVAFYSWMLHILMAAVAVPFVLGHIFMAAVNPDTRPGLQGMISGWVDRAWARHHHAIWFRQTFGDAETPTEALSDPALPANPLQDEARVHCPSCSAEYATPWAELARQVSGNDPLPCPDCGAEIAVVTATADSPALTSWALSGILGHLASESGPALPVNPAAPATDPAEG